MCSLNTWHYKNNKLGSRSDKCLEWRYNRGYTLMHVYVLLSDRPVCVVPVKVEAAGRLVLPSHFAPSFKAYSYTYSNNTCTLTFWRCSQESGVKAKSDDVHAGNPTLEQSEAEESVLSKPSLWSFQLPILSWFLWVQVRLRLFGPFGMLEAGAALNPEGGEAPGRERLPRAALGNRSCKGWTNVRCVTVLVRPDERPTV